MLAKDSNRRGAKAGDKGQSLRYEWMREFYRIRGDFAHGKLSSRQATEWEPLEHLVLAAIAFPLVVKELLNRSGKYDLTGRDRGEIDAFEQFADTSGFLKPPTDQKSSLDSHWERSVDDRRWKRTTKEIAEKLKEHRKMASGGDKQACDSGELHAKDK